MKIFSDFHHSGLGYALHLLLEKRLGHELYFPIGQEWFDNSYWCIAEPYNNSPDTIKQYLDLDHRYTPKDGTVSLNHVVGVHPTHYEIMDFAHNYNRKCITWDQFQAMDVDIIIGSIPRHWQVYRQLRDIYKKKAKVVCQMGNMFEEVDGMMTEGIIQNLLSSTSKFDTRHWVNSLFYHQEIDTDVFKYVEPTYGKITRVTSFVNLLPAKDIYDTYKHNFSIQSDGIFEFNAFGSGTPNGNIHTIQEMAAYMAGSHWGWHVKPRGDGFGHVLYDWAAIGRPIITNFSDYRDKLGGELLVDGVTAINLETGSVEENIKRIKNYSEPEKHKQMCEAMRLRFNKYVDYNKESSEVKKFLENLL